MALPPSPMAAAPPSAQPAAGHQPVPKQGQDPVPGRPAPESTPLRTGAGDAGGGVSSNSAIATCRNELAVTVAITPCRPNAKSGWSGTETTIVAEPLASVTDDARSTAPAPPSRLTWSTPPGGKPATVATIGVPAGPDTGLRRILQPLLQPLRTCRDAALSTGTTHVVVAPCTPSRSYRRAGGATWMVGAMPARPTAGSGWLRSRFETLWATVPSPPNS